MYTIKRAVVDYYCGDNKVNDAMKAALISNYEKYQLYKFDNCNKIMAKAISCRSAKVFIKYAEQLEDELDKQFNLWKALKETKI